MNGRNSAYSFHGGVFLYNGRRSREAGYLKLKNSYAISNKIGSERRFNEHSALRGIKFDRINKTTAMNKKTLIPILLLLAVISVIYAVYKGTAVTMTTIETGKTVIYGQPQHGLTLGLCLFAGACVLGASLLAFDDRSKIANSDGQTSTTTTTATGNRVATNYPR